MEAWEKREGTYIMKKRIVFSDVDGTLLNSRHQVTALTQEAIRGLEEQGIPFVIVSARSPSGIYPILQECGFRCPIIAYSGALILDESKQVLFHRGMDKKRAGEIIEVIEGMEPEISWSIYSLDEWIVKDKTDPKILREEGIVKAEAIQGTVDTARDGQINKILCICDPGRILEAEQKLKAGFPECSIVKSSDILLEIMENGINKAAAVRMLCSLWDIQTENAAAFGDHYNDVEMLETVGHGFLMGNAPEELKCQFSNITRDHDHDGIYHGLMELGWIGHNI